MIKKLLNDYKFSKTNSLTYKHILNVVGGIGSGKSSIIKSFSEAWKNDNVISYPEIGGELRKIANSETFEHDAAFEIALLFLEEQLALKIDSYETKENEAKLHIVEGGFIQNLCHSLCRSYGSVSEEENLVRNLYFQRMYYWNSVSINSYVFLEHRDGYDNFSRAIKHNIESCLREKIIKQFIILSVEETTKYIKNPLEIPNLSDFLLKFVIS